MPRENSEKIIGNKETMAKGGETKKETNVAGPNTKYKKEKNGL